MRLPQAEFTGSGALLCSVLAYLYACEYTKVEESFNMQAMHDFLEYGFDYSHFDHLIFPGVVPRTSIGAFLVALLATTPHELLKLAGASKFSSQYLVRGLLGCLVFECLRRFKNSFVRHRAFAHAAPHCGRVFMLLSACQFHMPFYASRALPNVFALMGTLAAYSQWLQSRPLPALLIIGTAPAYLLCSPPAGAGAGTGAGAGAGTGTDAGTNPSPPTPASPRCSHQAHT